MSTGYVETPCVGCAATCFSTPEYRSSARCIECARRQYSIPADLHWLGDERYPWHPTVARVDAAPVERPTSAPAPVERSQVVVLKRGTEVQPDAWRIAPAEARRLVLAGGEAHPQWRCVLTHSVTLSENRKFIVDHVFIRAYRRSDGRPLGYCGWTAGHTTGGRIRGYRPDSPLRFDMVNLAEFAAWIRGVAYLPAAPAARGACPRCGKPDVRIKNDGQPFKHRHLSTDLECA